MSDQKFIVTEIKIENLDNKTIFKGHEIDTHNIVGVSYAIDTGVGQKDLKVGDIVGYDDDNYTYAKKQFPNCEPAIVTGVTKKSGIKFVMAFSAKYGDIEIELSNYTMPGGGERLNPFAYTQRGDEILVRQHQKEGIITYKIVTNQTVDKMRSGWLIKNSQKIK